MFEFCIPTRSTTMQHECNKSESSLQEILRHLWENTIDEILEDHGWDPQDAVEWVEILIAVRAGDAKIELPLPILLAVLDCAALWLGSSQDDAVRKGFIAVDASSASPAKDRQRFDRARVNRRTVEPRFAGNKYNCKHQLYNCKHQIIELQAAAG
jgi:hypothetical protein